MSNISERSKSRPPPSSSSGLTKRAVVLTAEAAAEATPLPTSVGVDGAKEVTPERKRVMVAMASFIVTGCAVVVRRKSLIKYYQSYGTINRNISPRG